MFHHYEFLSIDYLEQTSHGHIAIVGLPIIFIVVGVVLWSIKSHHHHSHK